MIVDEIFIPKKRFTVYNNEEVRYYIRVYNGKKNIYQSVYHYQDEPLASNAIIDKIFLDFDYDDDMKFYDDVKTVAKYLYQNEIQFYIRFSGRGFHIFVMVKKQHFTQPKFAIKQWVQDMHRRTNTKSDPAVIGDTRRVCRVLGTKNLKTNLYCIPIQYDMLQNMQYSDICALARKNHGRRDYVNGSLLLDLSEYDNYIPTYSKPSAPIQHDVKIADTYPPCIQRLLSIPDLGYNERRELIIYLRDDGYDEDEIMSILEATLSHEKFIHCIEEEHQLQYLMRREDILFSSCRSQKLNGICASTSCQGNNLYL